MIQFFSRRFRPRADGSRDEAGLAMIIAITVVMLMTLIPLAIFTQSVQQLPLARHDQDHEAALAAAEAGVDDYLNHLAQNQNYWTTTPATRRPTATPRSPPGSRYRARTTTTSASGTASTRAQTASTGIVYLTSSGKSRQCGPDREGRTAAAGLPRLPVAHRLRDHRPRPVGRECERVQVPCLGVELGGEYVRAEQHQQLQRRVLDDALGPERPGALERRLVRVREPDVQRRHRHVLQLADVEQRLPQHAVRRTRGACRTRSACSNAPVWSRNNDPAQGPIAAVPAREHTIKNQADAALGGTGCMYTGPTTITLKNVGGVGKMDVTSPTTRSTNAGCGPGTNLCSAGERRGLRAEHPDGDVEPELLVVQRNGVLRRRATSSGTLNGQLDDRVRGRHRHRRQRAVPRLSGRQ